MFDDRNARKLPLLSDYLTKSLAASRARDSGFWALASCVVTPLTLVFMTIVLGRFMSIWLAIGLSAVVGSPLVLSLMAGLNNLIQRPRTPDQVRAERFRQVLERYKVPLSRRKLHKELDPVAGQLLEAAAFHHNRIVVGLNGSGWTNLALPAHWGLLRVQILEAANDAMEDAATLSVDCIGKPATTRKGDLKDAIEGFADLEWVEALQNLGQVVSAPNDRYTYNSPHLPIVFEPVRGIADKLKLLAEEVEKRSAEVTRESFAFASSGPDTIDAVLQDMKALHVAETELNQQQRLGGGPG